MTRPQDHGEPAPRAQRGNGMSRRPKRGAQSEDPASRAADSAPPAAAPSIELLADNLDRAYRGRSWHGTSLHGSLRGLTPAIALWRPAPGRHCIWELLLHCAFWKHDVRRKLTGEAGAFPREGRDFPRLPAPANTLALRRDLELLHGQHARLREAVLALDPATLADRRGAWRRVDFVLGAAAHDLYHAGQVNLLKRLRG